jgi:hypothetical protein
MAIATSFTRVQQTVNPLLKRSLPIFLGGEYPAIPALQGEVPAYRQEGVQYKYNIEETPCRKAPPFRAESFTPAAESHGLWPWMNALTFGRDVAPHGR